MNQFTRMLLFTFAIAFSVTSTDLADFYSEKNSCDYLVITPRIFSDISKELVNYRNQNTLDDVEEAHQVILEDLPGYTLQEAAGQSDSKCIAMGLGKLGRKAQICSIDRR